MRSFSSVHVLPLPYMAFSLTLLAPLATNLGVGVGIPFACDCCEFTVSNDDVCRVAVELLARLLLVLYNIQLILESGRSTLGRGLIPLVSTML